MKAAETFISDLNMDDELFDSNSFAISSITF